MTGWMNFRVRVGTVETKRSREKDETTRDTVVVVDRVIFIIQMDTGRVLYVFIIRL